MDTGNGDGATGFALGAGTFSFTNPQYSMSGRHTVAIDEAPVKKGRDVATGVELNDPFLRELMPRLEVLLPVPHHHRPEASPQDLHISTMTPPAPAPVASSWGVHCKRCDVHMATQHHVTFIQENERSVHFGLRREVFEQAETRTEWTLRSSLQNGNGGGGMDCSFTKLRQTHVVKRTTTPFVLLCPSCQRKIGSEVVMNDWLHAELLFDSKACYILHTTHTEPPMVERIDYKKTARLMDTLVKRELLVHVRRATATADDTSDDDDGNSDGNGGELQQQQRKPQRKTKTKKTKTRPPPPPAMVWPTLDSIREHLSQYHARSKVSTLREYQMELVLGALLENTIVYLPTGCGKTLVAVKTITMMKALNPCRKAAFLVPTVPLVSQQATYLRRESDLNVLELSGQTTGATRRDKLSAADALVSTPQFFDNLVDSGLLRLDQFCVLVFDEAHHATGEHPYCDVLKRVAQLGYECQPRLVALTASPFGQKAVNPTTMRTNGAVQALCTAFSANLDTPTIAASALELRSVFKQVEWVAVEPCAAAQRLYEGIVSHVREINGLVPSLPVNGEEFHVGDVLPNDSSSSSSGDVDDCDQREEIYVFCGRLRKLQERVRSASAASSADPKDADTSSVLLSALLGHLRKLLMVLPQLALQGPRYLATTLCDYFGRVEKSESPLYELVQASYTRHLLPVLAQMMASSGSELLVEDEVSAKVKQVAQIVEASNFTTHSRAIVFVRRRKTAIQLAEIMEKIPSLRALNPTRFIGHNSYEGMTWEEEQRPTLERFRRGWIRLLVATSVLEEGLDVPECSLVIQFDGLAGMTSLVQSRGRARQVEGRFVVMCAQKKREKLQLMIDSELMMLELARITAADLQSKETTRALLCELETTGDCGTDGNVSTRTTAQETLKHTSVEGAVAEWSSLDRKFCIVLGSLSSSDERRLSASDRDAALAAIRGCNIVEIAAVDEALNLVALDVVKDDDADNGYTACYEALCRQLDFRMNGSSAFVSHFWMKMLSTPSTSGSGGLSVLISDESEKSVLHCDHILRGRFTTDETFESVSAYSSPDDEATCVRIDGNVFVIQVSQHIRFDFDLCGVHDGVLYVETTATAASEWILYATFRHPPKLWDPKTSTRILLDFHLQSLSFAFYVRSSSSTSVATMRSLRKQLVDVGIEVRDTSVNRVLMEPVPCEQEDEDEDEDKDDSPSSLWMEPPMVTYALQALTSRCCFAIGPRLPLALLEIVRKLSDEAIRVQALLQFEPIATTATALVTEFREFIRHQFPSLQGLAKLPQRVVLKAFVTPTRILFERPEIAPDNRVFRHFASHQFLYVYFRDETRELLDFADTELPMRVRRVMEQGIRIGASHFRFLGCSSSQLRNGSCIFTTLDPEQVRNWMGELHTITSPAKYFKRLGQAFSSTRETITVHPRVLLEPQDDIEDETKRYVFTDGCGEITTSAATSVARVLKLPVVPSAFQIRLGGAKGVLVVSDFDDETTTRSRDQQQSEGHCGVRLRKSMVKFKSLHHKLEIVAPASAHSIAYLSRQSVNILSDLGIPEMTFLSLQDEFIASLATMVVSQSQGIDALQATLPPDQMWWIDMIYGRLANDRVKLDLVHRRIIHAIYQYRLTTTVLRARIPIRNGRNLMGVADFTGTLQYGEVFVQYSERDADREDHFVVLSDVDVLVHRNPCHHPGDLRVLRCRGGDDVPLALKMLHDCIVFPTCGPRPHPDECTGGDLDGDTFTVIWDERLLPPRANIVEAMTLTEDLDAPQAETADHKKELVDVPRLISYYLFASQHGILGQASNAHLAVCDVSSKPGCFARDALIVAELCAREVDGYRNPKHLELLKSLTPPQYPDFLRNTEKTAYKSSKVLGKMYRRALVLMTATAPNFHGASACELDESYLTDGYTTYEDAARVVYDQYKHAVRMLFRMSGAISEAELATGMIIETPSEYRANYFRVGERSRDSFYNMQCLFKDQFVNAYGGLPECEKRRIAAAWYAVAYKDTSADHCLSFPWILADLLIHKSLRCDEQLLTRARGTIPPAATTRGYDDKVLELTTCQLQLCILNQIEERFSALLAGFHDRLQALTALRLALIPHFGAQDLGCVLFGSSSLLTFEPQSDLDIVLQPVRDVADLKALNRFAATAEGMAVMNLIENTHVPVLSLSVEGNWTVEISTARNGPIKTKWFRAYMVAYPFFWPVAFFLTKWGKAAGLIRRRCVAGDGNGQSMFTPVGFLWLLLSFCLENQFMTPIACPSESDALASIDSDVEMAFWATLLQRAIKPSTSEATTVSAAHVMVRFFSYFGDVSTPQRAFGFDDPLDPLNDTRLTPDHTELFREACYLALHQLIISNGDLVSLLHNQKDHRRRITLSRALSKHVHASREFYAAKILRESNVPQANAKLTFTRHPNALRPDLYVADIEGDGDAVRQIQEKIERIEEALGTPQPRRPTDRFHRSGCCLLLFEGAVSQSEKIAFQTYVRSHHVAHDHYELHQAHLASFMNGKAWLEHAVDALTTKFIRQMVKLSHFEKLNPGQATAKAIARFGHHYLIHLPWSFHEESITLATIERLEHEFERGREARELYESVLVARQRDRKSNQSTCQEEEEEERGGEDGGGGGGSGGGGGQSKAKTQAKGASPDTATKRPTRRPMTALSPMQKAGAMTTRDRGVAHSFYPLIDPSVAPYLHDFAIKRKHMHEVARSESYQVSIVKDSCEFNVRLTPTLELVKVKTRPCRWLSATLKMRQELVGDGSHMEPIPDIRFYVSATEDVPSSDSLPQLLERACAQAPNGHGVLQFVSEDAAALVDGSSSPRRIRVSGELVRLGVELSSIVNVRHMRAITYQSPHDGVEFRVLEVVEYTLPNDEGFFVNTTRKTEAEMVMPALTPEARVSACFARRFVLAGVELVEFLRDQVRSGLADD